MLLVTVGTYDYLFEAELAKLQLESYDIISVLKDAEMVHLMPIYNLTVGGIKLQVNEADAPTAVKLLEEMKASPDVTCPHCGGSDYITNQPKVKRDDSQYFYPS